MKPPDSLALRIFALLVGGIFLSLAVTVWLGRREQLIWMRRAHVLHAADQMEQFVRILEMLPPESRPDLLAGAPKMGMLVQPHSPPPGVVDKRLDEELQGLLSLRLGRSSVLVVQGGCARLRLGDGTELELLALPPHSPPGPRLHFWLVEALFVLSILGLAYLVALMSTRPLNGLAQAAQALAADLERPPLKVVGPREIRQATAAFNEMQHRLVSNIKQRNYMLAAIAHDLQTPLTRLRLRLEKVQDATLQQRLLQDLSAMQQMVSEGLELARSVDSREVPVQVDLFSLLDSLCEDAREAGLKVTLQEASPYPQLALRVSPIDLKRCLNNLIENAVKYGGSASIGVSWEAAQVTFCVSDTGPGMPVEQLERVFEPFVRLEESRSRESGGSGLGLTIARNLAVRQGGKVWLENDPQGGLRAYLSLPRVGVSGR